jgi:starch phosphorylase
MKPIRTFSVVPNLPAPLEGVRKLAYNLRWAWNHETLELFRRLDSDLWESCGHNPVSMLGKIDQAKLQAAAGDDAFLAHLDRVETSLDAYLSGKPTWFSRLTWKRTNPAGGGFLG